MTSACTFGIADHAGSAMGSREKIANKTSIDSSAKLRVLLVDDNPFHRRLGSAVLDRMGFEVITVDDGPTAIARYQSADFDLVFMSTWMPNMNGFEAARMIRKIQHEQRRTIPIIAMTSHSSVDDPPTCPTVAMDGSLTKPLLEQELRRVMLSLSFNTPDLLEPEPGNWALDPESIRAAFPMTDQAMANVVRLFRASCIELTGQMRFAIEDQNASIVSRAIHALRGSLGMFATSSAIELLTLLDQRAKVGDFLNARVILVRLEHAIASLEQTLDRLSLLRET